jgi:hypothetical protein
MRPRLRWLLLAVLGCASACSPRVGVEPGPRAATAQPTALKPAPTGALPATSEAASPDVRFEGMCDASGAVPLSRSTFAVADDEDNVLRVYDADRGGAPLYAKDISLGLGIAPKPRKDPSQPPKPPAEADIEAATLYGGLALWLTSHGLNSSGKLRPERFRFFATTLPDHAVDLAVVGQPYTGLIAELNADARYREFGLAEAATLAPKEPGGLNLEGMTSRREGGVFIGFRNPTPQGRALIVVLENPDRVIQGEAARFGAPATLDLGGLGIRSLSSWHGRYLISAGHYASGAPPRLYVWDGVSTTPAALELTLADFNPEGFFTPEDRDQIMLLSDDGSTLRDGIECKRLSDPGQRSFRGRWVTLPRSE